MLHTINHFLPNSQNVSYILINAFRTPEIYGKIIIPFTTVFVYVLPTIWILFWLISSTILVISSYVRP